MMVTSCMSWTGLPESQTNYLTLPAIHCLLIKFLANEEVDLSGADSGGGLDVELLPILPDLHMGLGCSCPRYLP